MDTRKKGYSAFCSLALSVALFFPSPSWGDQELRGPAFSDPSIIHVPDPQWADKPIKYSDGNADADLVVDMNQQLYPFLLPAIEEFARKEKIDVKIYEGTCGKAAGRLNRREIDVGGFCCPPGNLDRLPGLRFHTLGISPLAILVNGSNRVDNVTLEQARQIFQGLITSWDALGGTNDNISMIASLHCAKRPGHWRLLLDNENLFSTRFLEVGDMPDQIRLISTTPNAIGYETLWVASRFGEKAAVKGLKLNGIHPSELHRLEEGSYPVYRVFNITTWQGEGLSNPHAAKLVDLLMRKVEEIGPSYGLVPADRLRRAGWKFEGAELVGEPD
jgi:phosphate transport system substrate-binding protein